MNNIFHQNYIKCVQKVQYESSKNATICVHTLYLPERVVWEKPDTFLVCVSPLSRVYQTSSCLKVAYTGGGGGVAEAGVNAATEEVFPYTARSDIVSFGTSIANTILKHPLFE